MTEITIEDLKKFLKSNYIQKGWLDDLKNEMFIEEHAYKIKENRKFIEKTSNICDCINLCQSPTGKNKEEKLKAIFKAFSLFSLDDTRILIIGQDPYPSKGRNKGRAHGLAFSFGNNTKAEDSLKNIFKAIYKYKKFNKDFNEITDNDISKFPTNLANWAEKNEVLLLNTSLTYQEGQKSKHQIVWNTFIKYIITKLLTCNAKKLVVFLWGIDAQKLFFECINSFGINDCDYNITNKIIINSKHELNKITRKVLCLISSHPSPQSFYVSFKDDAPKQFKECDEFLGKNKERKYTWLNFPEDNQ